MKVEGYFGERMDNFFMKKSAFLHSFHEEATFSVFFFFEKFF
jgi:hypothetical protein